MGQGQFGRVYCAAHRRTGHLFALKELDLQRFPTRQFLRELRFLLSLHHPNIVTCHALEHTSTTRYLVLDYCEGGTLRSLLEEVRLTPLHSLQLVTDILVGLSHAHSCGIVHCDIKPENVLLNLRSQGWTAQISDFGIARLEQESRFRMGNTGSPAYMAPERFYGQYSYASDLYSVGVLLYELLVGQRPFSGLPGELMAAHLNQPVQFPSHLPPNLQAILLSALQKLPARRFRSTAAMLEAVSAAAEELRSTTNLNTALLRPIASLPPTPCPSLHQEALTAKVWQLYFSSARVYRRSDQQVYASHPTTGSLTTIVLPDSIQNLTVGPQGCFVATQRRLYWLPVELFQVDSTSSPRLIGEFDKNWIAAIDPQGRWMTTATTAGIDFWRSPTVQLRKIATALPSSRLFQLLVLDSRHLLAVGYAGDRSASPPRVRLEVFTRRGTLVTSIDLPVPVQQVTLSPQPYRLIAIEPNHPASLLVMDLKPFRLRRLAVEIVPWLMVAASWGYLLSDRAGQIVLLDRYGQAIGRLAGPSHPSAIALLEPYTLLIATWKDGAGTLHTIDLSQLNLDIVF